jgi:hypothetical protein
MIPGMDPLSMMFMAAGQQQPGAQSLLNPQGSQPMPMMPNQSPGPQAPGVPGAPAQGGNSLGELFAGVKAPEAQAPKFSGGVSGSQLPYLARIEDMISPFMQATHPAQAGMLPTLGSLISQAPGGGR